MCTPLKVIPLLLLLLSVCACSNEPSAGANKQKEITIHAAVSLSAMIRELGDHFSAKHDLSINYNFSSSGALARQLIAAPRGEIYLSANQQWMPKLSSIEAKPAGSREIRLYSDKPFAHTPRLSTCQPP